MAAIAVDGFLMWWLFFSLFSRINSTFFGLMEWNHIMLCELYAARYCQLTMVMRVNLLRSSLFASTKWLPWHSYSEISDRQSQPQYVMTFNFSTLVKDPILFWHLWMYVRLFQEIIRICSGMATMDHKKLSTASNSRRKSQLSIFSDKSNTFQVRIDVAITAVLLVFWKKTNVYFNSDRSRKMDSSYLHNNSEYNLASFGSCRSSWMRLWVSFRCITANTYSYGTV